MPKLEKVSEHFKKNKPMAEVKLDLEGVMVKVKTNIPFSVQQEFMELLLTQHTMVELHPTISGAI